MDGPHQRIVRTPHGFVIREGRGYDSDDDDLATLQPYELRHVVEKLLNANAYLERKLEKRSVDNTSHQIRAELEKCRKSLEVRTDERDRLSNTLRNVNDALVVRGNTINTLQEELKERTDELKVLREDWDRRLKEERQRLVHEERDRIVREERAQLVKTERERLIRLLTEEPSEKKEDAESFEPQCSVCLDAKLEMVIEPCGHITTCEACTLKISKCPICRGPKVRTLRAYLH